MYLALQIGSVDLNPILRGVVATILYFLVGMAVLEVLAGSSKAVIPERHAEQYRRGT